MLKCVRRGNNTFWGSDERTLGQRGEGMHSLSPCSVLDLHQPCPFSLMKHCAMQTYILCTDVQQWFFNHNLSFLDEKRHTLQVQPTILQMNTSIIWLTDIIKQNSQIVLLLLRISTDRLLFLSTNSWGKNLALLLPKRFTVFTNFVCNLVQGW